MVGVSSYTTFLVQIKTLPTAVILNPTVMELLLALLCPFLLASLSYSSSGCQKVMETRPSFNFFVREHFLTLPMGEAPFNIRLRCREENNDTFATLDSDTISKDNCFNYTTSCSTRPNQTQLRSSCNISCHVTDCYQSADSDLRLTCKRESTGRNFPNCIVSCTVSGPSNMSQSDDRHFLRGYCTRRRNQSCPVQQIRDMVCKQLLTRENLTELSGDDDKSAFIVALKNYLSDLDLRCVARGIQHIFCPSNRMGCVKRQNYMEMLSLLNNIFSRDYSYKWKRQSFSDAKDILAVTDKILYQLAKDRKYEKSDFNHKEDNLVFQVEKVKGTNYNYPPQSDFSIPRRASVNFSIPKEKLTRCNITVGVSIIDNFAHYIGEIINTTNSRNREPVGALVSVVVVNFNESDESCSDFSDDPIKLTFWPNQMIPDNFTYEGNYLEIGNNSLEWNNSGLNTTLQDDGSVLVLVSHLTSFAILVSPTGSVQDSVALDVVSYVGCAVSIVCLLLTIICLLVFRKKLKKGVLLHVHVNLAVALLLALLFFVFGVDLAISNSVLCKTMAALTQYFFLCTFLWMLGEGVILYVLLVRVFGNLTDKWYILIPFCWGFPIPLVAISAGLLHDDYISETYCWINADFKEPAIWTFLGPIILIIIINTVILVLTLCSIVKTKKYVSGITENKKSTVDLVMVTLKGSVILLPLLGLTWVLGIFAVENNMPVFAWLFTIINSLQGCSIFVIHVLRNEYIWGKVKMLVSKCQYGGRTKSQLSSLQLVTPDGKTATSLAKNASKMSFTNEVPSSNDVPSFNIKSVNITPDSVPPAAENNS